MIKMIISFSPNLVVHTAITHKNAVFVLFPHHRKIGAYLGVKSTPCTPYSEVYFKFPSSAAVIHHDFGTFLLGASSEADVYIEAISILHAFSNKCFTTLFDRSHLFPRANTSCHLWTTCNVGYNNLL